MTRSRSASWTVDQLQKLMRALQKIQGVSRRAAAW